jgi:hypothetical protein
MLDRAPHFAAAAAFVRLILARTLAPGKRGRKPRNQALRSMRIKTGASP